MDSPQSMRVGSSLRMRFEEEQSLSPSYCESNSGYRNEGTDMLLLLFQELNAQNVGLKGHGFFTCSYGFIGTVRRHAWGMFYVPKEARFNFFF